MRRDLQEILCCPVCRGDLDLVVVTGDEVEVVDGVLRCGACQVDYVIEEGIPNLLPPDTGGP